MSGLDVNEAKLYKSIRNNDCQKSDTWGAPSKLSNYEL